MSGQEVILEVTSFRGDVGDKSRPRSVSFHLPEHHDEQKEKEKDTAGDNCRLQTMDNRSAEILITKKNGTQVLITETKATYIPATDKKQLSKEEHSRHFCFLKVFATVGAVMFPPLGIPALIFAFKAQNIDKCALKHTESIEQCTKAVKISERLIVMSVVFGLIMWCIVIIAIEMHQKSRLINASEQLSES